MFGYSSHVLLDWKSRMKHMHGGSTFQGKDYARTLLEPCLFDVAPLSVALRGGTTSTMRWPKCATWPSALKGQNLHPFHASHMLSISCANVSFKHVNHLTFDALPKHVPFDSLIAISCIPMSISLHAYNPLAKGMFARCCRESQERPFLLGDVKGQNEP